ncbi:MAG: hypothetical protein HW402_178 [Dehalococcoidales bacterium]|nr:hypothetical protein [Dehalococcoidales bacterium]
MSQRLTSEKVQVDDSAEAVNDLFLEKGWSDGLPVIPPTEEAVERMLAGTNRNPADVVAAIPPRWGEATIEKIAINAVMAGCLPEYLPIITTAVTAMCEEPFNLPAVQPTTHPSAPLLIINGPITKKLNINSKYGAFGPGWRSNATIGRAIRLILMNIGGALPGKTDMSTQGQPCKYTFCIAENEDANPWEPLHVERGFAASTSTVTVVAAENPHNINEHTAVTAEELLTTVISTMTTMGNNDVLYQRGSPVLALGPEHAATLAKNGFSKEDVRTFVYKHARIPLSKFYKGAIQRYYANMDENALIPISARKENLIIIVVGGAGKHSSFLPTFGMSYSVTRAIQ